MGFRMGGSVKDYLVWPAGLSLNVSFLTSIQSRKFSFHDYLCGWSLRFAFPLTTLMFSLVPTFYLSSPLSFPSLVFKGNYHFTSEMSEILHFRCISRSLVGMNEILHRQRWVALSHPDPTSSDIAVFETRQDFCILSSPNSFLCRALLCYFMI